MGLGKCLRHRHSPSAQEVQQVTFQKGRGSFPVWPVWFPAAGRLRAKATLGASQFPFPKQVVLLEATLSKPRRMGIPRDSARGPGRRLGTLGTL